MEIHEDGAPTTPIQESEDKQVEIQPEEDVNMPRQPNLSGTKGLGTTELHVRKPMIQKYGYIDHCQVCRRMRHITRQVGDTSGRWGTDQSKECRERIMEAMLQDPIDRHIAEADERRTTRQHEKRDAPDDTKEPQGNNDQTSGADNGEHGSGKDMGSQMFAQDITNNDHNRVVTTTESDLERSTCRAMDVAEVYSPQRATRIARGLGLRAGWAADFTTIGEHWDHWLFDRIEVRNNAARELMSDKPILFIGSPVCTGFCIWMAIGNKQEVVAEWLRRARRHLEVCFQLYLLRLDVGR